MGGSKPNRLDWLGIPAIWTEKNLVVSFAVPGVSVHAIPVVGSLTLALEVMTTTGTINSWGDKPPWKYRRFPPATLKMAKLAGVAMSNSLSIPR